MMESIAFSAFLLGIISACSLPLGSLTSFYWKPTERTTSFLIAFGGGALLAALTLDLVASTVSHGYFYPLAVGCIIGGLLFIVLNEMVNDYGGFMRKASTHLYHLRKLEHKRFKQILSSVQRVDVFKELSGQDFKALAASIRYRDVKKGVLIYQQGDPADHLYIIARGEGTVELCNSHNELPVKQYKQNDVFGWLAFLTGSTSRYSARVTEDTGLWILPRATFMSLLRNSSTLRQAVHICLRSAAVVEYLNDQGLSEKQVKGWSNDAVHHLLQQGDYEDALPVEHQAEQFMQIANRLGKISLFDGLPVDELEVITSRLIYKQFARGEAFFYKGADADRVYIIDQGEALILDDSGETFTHGDRDAFGFMACFTGSRHGLSAVAESDTKVWMLRRSDYDDLLQQLPEFARRVKFFYQSEGLKQYLVNYQCLSVEKVLTWSQKAIANIDAKEHIAPARHLEFDVVRHKDAPLAIWLGMLLDGIPESLVIGASLSQSNVSLSLIAGLFLANYPEALSSSLGMQEQGMKKKKILLMWLMLMFITGVFAALGSLFFMGASSATLATIEGLAAGAMLTMIAQTMLPEAYLKGGDIVGFSTLLGFLTAIFFKTLE